MDTSSTSAYARQLKSIRIWLILFMIGLVLSGITAFPLVTELAILNTYFGMNSNLGSAIPSLGKWISHVNNALQETNSKYPLIFYGTDWLAFAHIVISIVFIGPVIDPIRNKWVVKFGMIACVLVFPLALICGPIRSIPWFWMVIDCSFGIIGFIPLWLTMRKIERLEKLPAH